MEEKNESTLFAERMKRYIDMMHKSKDPQLKQVAEELLMRELSGIDDRELEPIPDEVFKDPAVQEYINASPNAENERKKPYATEKRAKAQEKIAEMPEKLNTITHQPLKNALLPLKEGEAFLQPLKMAEAAEKLTVENGKLFFDGYEASMAQLKQLYTDEIPDIDLPFLQMMYSVVLKNYDTTMSEDNSINQVISIYLPNFMRAMGAPTAKEREFEIFKAKILSYQTVLGVFPGTGAQAVLVYLGEDKEKNVIRFSAPYLEVLVRKLYKVSIRRNKMGDPMLDRKGQLITLPVNSYTISPEILKDKSKYAVINVINLISLIKAAGERVPHIRAKSIVDRNPQFKEALEKSAPKDRNIQLKRVFTKTWELLRKETSLLEEYPEMLLPDPKDPANIPTWKTLNMVFEFPKYKEDYKTVDNTQKNKI